MKSTSLTKLGQNIRRLRKEQHISQEELARRAGIDRTYMGGIERGERNITLLMLEKISKALGADGKDLL